MPDPLDNASSCLESAAKELEEARRRAGETAGAAEIGLLAEEVADVLMRVRAQRVLIESKQPLP